MTIQKEQLSDLKEKIELAQKLIEDCKGDSLEPYKSHYKARSLSRYEKSGDIVLFISIAGKRPAE